MASTMNPLSIEALQLPPQERLGLATLLIESLDEPSDFVDLDLLKDLTKRASELRSGKVVSLSTEEAYGFSL